VTTLTLILIGIAIAVDPIPLTAYLVLLPSRRGVRKGAGFVFGWLISLAIVVAITVAATGNNPPAPKTAPSLAALSVKAAIGFVLIIIGYRRRQRLGQPKEPKSPPKWQQRVDDMSPWYAIGIGPLVQPWGLIAAGSATVVNAKLSNAASYIALILFCLIGSSSYIGLLLYAAFRPERSAQVFAAVRTWIDNHTDQAIVIGSLVLGLWLLVSSVYYMLT
jgi:hypothetical protein